MSKKIDWVLSARNSYLTVLGYLIDAGAVKAALKIEDERVKKFKLLSKFPSIGSFTQKRDVRKLILGKHYLLIYKELDCSIIIIAFIDARSDHPY